MDSRREADGRGRTAVHGSGGPGRAWREPKPWSVAERRSSRIALLRTRRSSSCSKASKSCSSLEAVRSRSTALGRIAPEAGEAGVEAGQARRPPMTAGGVETCPHSISSEVVEEEVVVEGATGLLALRTLRASLCSRVLRSALHAFRTPSVDMMIVDP